MNSPSPSGARQLAAVLIDVVVLLVIVPMIALLLGGIMAELLGRGTTDCSSPCDGPAMVGFGVASMLMIVVWLLYWPVSIYLLRNTIGSCLLGLHFAGRGLRRHLVNGSQPDTQASIPPDGLADR